MPSFILNQDFIAKLSSIRADYEDRTKTTLSESPQPNAVSLFFGAKDVETRNKQIHFIEQWIAVLIKDLEVFDRNRSLRALQVLVGLCFYIKSQIGEAYILRSPTSSILGQLIDEALGISSNNPIDEETRQTCLLSTQRFLNYPDCLEEVNSIIAPESYSEIEWHALINFISEQTKTIDSGFLKDYPITAYTIPVFSRPMELAGITIGYCAGQTLANTTQFIPARDKLTAVISAGVFMVMGPGAGMGVALLAPTCASRILDTFCGISLAVVMGSTMKILGQGVGLGVGMSLDLGYKFLSRLTSAIMDMKNQPQTGPTGISLLDGSCWINGESVELLYLAHQKEFIDTKDSSSEALLQAANPMELPYYCLQTNSLQTLSGASYLLNSAPEPLLYEEEATEACSSKACI